MFQHRPVTIKTFLESPEFVSNEDKARPHNKQVLIEIFDDGNYEEVLYIAGVGSGKCLAKGTKVLMYSGKVKKVEEIKVGERIMGDDSTPRVVLSTTRGKEPLYKIVPVKGEPFTVNESHILSLKERYGLNSSKRRITNISVNSYLGKSKTFKRRTPLYKPTKPISFGKIYKPKVNPYLIGLWIADGRKNNFSFSVNNKDVEIRKCIEDESKNIKNSSISIRNIQGNSSDISIVFYKQKNNPLNDYLKELNIFENKHIPQLLRVMNVNDRLSFLAGFIDGDGCLLKGNTVCYSVTSSKKDIIDGIEFITRSLGFSFNKRKRVRSDKRTKKTYSAYEAIIGGDIERIPVKLERKKIRSVTRKRDWNITGFEIKSIGVGEYYGFTLDKNHLYLLGDFTVTHNSFLASKAIEFIIYNLLCLKNPQKFFHFARGTRIAFVNISRSFTQAKDVVFGEIKNRIDNNPWFQKYYPPDSRIKSKIRLPKSIFILPLGSNEESPLGYNIFGAVIDEASFHTATADKDYAEESYNQIKKRIRSRFLDRGRLFIITSPKYIYDFAEKKFADDDNPKLYKRRTPLWEAMPEELFSGKKFDLGDYLENFKGIMVPVEYELEFKTNPEKAMRDYGAQPSLAIQGFFRDPGIIIERVSKDRKHPIDKKSGDFSEWFYNPSGAENYDSDPRYIHVDLGLNRAGKGCATGICISEGQKVLLGSLNYKNIEDIKVGDKVMTSSNKASAVLRKIDSGIKRVVSIKAALGTKIEATGDHQVLSVLRKEISEIPDRGRYSPLKPPIEGKKKYRKTINKYKEGYVPRYRAVSSLSIGDYLCVPKPKIIEQHEFKGVPLNYDIGYLTGIFAAEGHYNKQRPSATLRFSLGIQEEDIANKITSVVEEYFSCTTCVVKRPQYNRLTVSVSKSETLFEFISSICKEYAENKDIELGLQGNSQFHRGLLKGLIDGDGWINRDKGKIGFKTISKNLFDKVWWLFVSYGFIPTWFKESGRKQTIHNNKKPSWCKPSYSITLNSKEQIDRFESWTGGLMQIKGSLVVNTDNFLLVPIKEIKTVGDKQVYDLTVARGNSFVIDRIVVHNCMGKQDGWQEIKTPAGRIEKRPKIRIDYMEQITAGPKEEILFKDVRKKIYRLKEIGYNIKLTTFDSWNSRDSIQMLRETGIHADVFSVDRKPEAYHSLKSAILEDRISYYDYPVFITECQQLEEIKGTKIDHPRLGCFTGETEIRLLDGSKKSIKELANKGADHEFWVYSTLKDGTIVPKKAYNAHKEKTVKKILEVELDNGRKVRCTPEHLFVLRNGEYKQASSLKKGDSLMPLKIHRGAAIKKRVENIKVIDGKFDVYDISIKDETVPNFALAAGVFVHNSKDVSDAVSAVVWQCSQGKSGRGLLGA